MTKFLLISLGSLVLAASIGLIDHKVPSRTPDKDTLAMPRENEVFATGVVEGRTESIQLRTEATGRVRDLKVAVGDWVNPGDIILRLDDRAEQAEAATALANVNLAQAKLDRLVNGARDYERLEARAMLAGKRAQLQQAELTWQRVQKLRAGNAVTEQEADDKACQVRTLAAEMEAADARVKQLESPAREDELQAAGPRLLPPRRSIKPPRWPWTR